jgi:hypothetical protein
MTYYVISMTTKDGKKFPLGIYKGLQPSDNRKGFEKKSYPTV